MVDAAQNAIEEARESGEVAHVPTTIPPGVTPHDAPVAALTPVPVPAQVWSTLFRFAVIGLCNGNLCCG